MRARWPILCLALLALLSLAASTRAQDEDIFSSEAVAQEEKALRRLKPADKLKVRHALNLLHRAVTVAGVSNSRVEIAAANARAGEAVDAAASSIPDGVLKGTLEASRKALTHCFILRLVNVGALDPEAGPVAEHLEEIVLRYQLASVPAYDRAARVLEFAGAHLLIADRVSAQVGITRKRSGVKPGK